MKDLAKQLRRDFKKALPSFKFSVTSDYNSITISIMEGDVDFGVEYEQVNHYHVDRDYKGEAKQILGLIVDVATIDRKTISVDSDYGSIPNYYLNVQKGKWNRPYSLRA